MFLSLMGLGLVAGAWITSLFVTKADGLAGGAIVFWGALGGLVLGGILALMGQLKLRARVIVILNIIVALILFLIVTLLARNTQAAPMQHGDSEMGIGLAKPDFYQHKTIYFYQPNLEKARDEHSPVDSLQFLQTELGYTLSYAPPWFYPQHLKLDYDLLYLKIISRTQDWVQVEVNQQTQQRAWLDITQLTLSSWESVLMGAASVTVLDAGANPLRFKPMGHAAIVPLSGVLYKPVEIRSNWLRIAVYDDAHQLQGYGWVQWRSAHQLLVGYSLLS